MKCGVRDGNLHAATREFPMLSVGWQLHAANVEGPETGLTLSSSRCPVAPSKHMNRFDGLVAAGFRVPSHRAVPHDVVRAHRGSISASNQSIGALFVIDLPAAGADRNAS
jgi:hypothetical protein